MKRSLAILLVLMMLLSFALVGCTNTDVPESNDEEIEKEDGVNEEITDKENNSIEEGSDNMALERGNVLTVATSSLKGLFNPILANDVYDMWVTSAVFEPLVGYDASGAVAANGIATDWNISSNKLTYTFNIEEGIKFHDGEELTAEDVEFTYYAIADPEYDGSRGTAVADIIGVEAYRAGDADTIEGIKVIDDYTISFTITRPNVSKIRDFGYGILPKHYYAYDNWDEFKSKLKEPVGSGIMKFKSYEAGQFVELETYKDYYREPAKIDGVIIRVIPEENQATAVASGQVDLANPSASIESYETMIDTGIADVQELLDNSYRYIGFNLRKAKFADKRVRQALAYGIRMDEYIKNEWQGFAQAANSPISPVSWAAPDQSELNTYDYNPEKAQALLAEAGWIKNEEGRLMKEGQPFVIEWTTYSEAEWPLNLIAVAENNWGQLGIEVNASVMDFNTVVTRVFDQQDFDVWNMSWSLAIDPDPYAIFHSNSTRPGRFNAGGFVNERADEIIAAGRNEYNQNVRARLYQEWAKLANEELPYIFVSIGTRIWGVNNRVKNIELGPYWDWVSNLNTIELEYKE